MENVITVIIAAAGFVVGFGISFAMKKSAHSAKAAEMEAAAAKKIEEADAFLSRTRKEADTIAKEARLEAKETVLRANADFEQKMLERKKEIETIENRLLHREKTFDKKIEQAERREQDLTRKEERLDEIKRGLEEKRDELDQLLDKQVERLEEMSGMTADQAKTEIKERLFGEARLESAGALKQMEEQTRQEANEKAHFIIAQAIQRVATDHVAENTVSVVDLPNDEMKGRIIGREGRNIRALEVATGVDLIIDDTPNAVIVSCFDPVKREIARQTLSKLIHDGRIHPGRIEETVSKVTKDVEATIKEDGEKAVFELGLDGIHPEVIKILGRLRYRTSYSQNVLRHSIEVGFLAGMMAAELGQDVKLARRAGLLHDLGKALDQNQEGTHTQIGVEIARRYNEPKVVINSIASHHEDVPAESVIAVLVAAGDALSASRPGARREMLQNYINRMQKLEEIGQSFPGVEQVYAIQAGREIRVVVEPDSIRDSEAFFLAKDIAKKIEGELAYPGEIKVTVIRETRVTDFAR
jgi:ribonuclease Y